MRANTAQKKHPELTKSGFAKFPCNNFAQLSFSSKTRDGSRCVDTFFRKNPKRARLKKNIPRLQICKGYSGGLTKAAK